MFRTLIFEKKYSPLNLEENTVLFSTHFPFQFFRCIFTCECIHSPTQTHIVHYNTNRIVVYRHAFDCMRQWSASLNAYGISSPADDLLWKCFERKIRIRMLLSSILGIKSKSIVIEAAIWTKNDDKIMPSSSSSPFEFNIFIHIFFFFCSHPSQIIIIN